MTDNTETIVCITRSYEHADFVRHAIMNSCKGAWVLVSRLPVVDGDISCEVYAMNERAGRLNKQQLDQIQEVVDRASEEFVTLSKMKQGDCLEAKPNYPIEQLFQLRTTVSTSSCP